MNVSRNELVSRDELVDRIRRGAFRKIFVVKGDMTYDVKSKVDDGDDLGVLGFAFEQGKGLQWLKEGDSYYVGSIDVSAEFAHHSLKTGKRLKEVL